MRASIPTKGTGREFVSLRGKMGHGLNNVALNLPLLIILKKQIVGENAGICPDCFILVACFVLFCILAVHIVERGESGALIGKSEQPDRISAFTLRFYDQRGSSTRTHPGVPSLRNRSTGELFISSSAITRWKTFALSCAIRASLSLAFRRDLCTAVPRCMR